MANRAIVVANYFVKLSKEKGIPLTVMQLLKLVYIAHGWNLAINDKPLFTEQVEVRPFGPIVKSVYDAFKKYGIGPIENVENDPIFNFGTNSVFLHAFFNESEKEIMDTVYEDYSLYDGLTLSKLTHDEDTPWTSAFKEGKRYISNDDIKAYFINFVEKYAGV